MLCTSITCADWCYEPQLHQSVHRAGRQSALLILVSVIIEDCSTATSLGRCRLQFSPLIGLEMKALCPAGLGGASTVDTIRHSFLNSSQEQQCLFSRSSRPLSFCAPASGCLSPPPSKSIPIRCRRTISVTKPVRK